MSLAAYGAMLRLELMGLRGNVHDASRSTLLQPWKQQVREQKPRPVSQQKGRNAVML